MAWRWFLRMWPMSWWRWTCSERGACSFNLPRPSSLWAKETLFLPVYTFFWGLFSSPTLFAATGQQPTCSWFSFSCHAKSMAWTNRVIFPGFIMWATILWLFGCLASLDGPLVTISLFSQTYLSHLLLGVAWAVASFSRGEGRDVKHTYMQSMLKLVPWFVVTLSRTIDFFFFFLSRLAFLLVCSSLECV